MSYLQRMEKRHPGLRSFLTVLLSAAMVLNSVPTQAFAEVVNEPQVVEIESVEDETDATLDETKATEGEQPADEQSEGQQDEIAEPEGEEEVVAPEGEQAVEEELADEQGDEQGEPAAPLLAAPAPLTAQADESFTYTVEYYDRDGNPMTSKPADIKNLYYFRYIVNKGTDIVAGYQMIPFTANGGTETAAVTNTFTAMGGGTIEFDATQHTIVSDRARVLQSESSPDPTSYSPQRMIDQEYDQSAGTMVWKFKSYAGHDQFEGYKFDNKTPNTLKL